MFPLLLLSSVVDTTLPLSMQMIDPKFLYISCSCAVSLPTVKISILTVGSVLCRPTSLWLQNPVLIFPVPQLGFVKLHHPLMIMNGGLLLLLLPFHLESSRAQPKLVIRPVHIAVINLPPGVAFLSILEIQDLVTFHR